MKRIISLAIVIGFVIAVAVAMSAHADTMLVFDNTPEVEKALKECEIEINKDVMTMTPEELREDICETVFLMKGGDCDILEEDLETYVRIKFTECMMKKLNEGS